MYCYKQFEFEILNYNTYDSSWKMYELEDIVIKELYNDYEG